MRHLRTKLICALLLMALNLATAFVGVYAWFVSGWRSDASGMRVQMYTHELDLSYRVYKYSDEVKGVIEATDFPDAFTLLEYDSVFTDRNDNTPIIVDFSLTGAALSAASPIYISADCTTQSPIAKALSNIIELKFALLEDVGSAASAIWSDAVDHFENAPGCRFKVGGNKDTSLEYTIDNYEGHVVGNTLRFFMQMNYADDLIDEFDFDWTDSQTTVFSNDLTTISCSVEGN